MAWYHTFFGPEFWTLVEFEYDSARTARETAFLESVLNAHAPGRRVADLACGTGRHAVALASGGFDVVGADMSAHALRTAQQRPGSDQVTWRQFDLMSTNWELDELDAALLVQSWGWGTDAQQRTLLRRIRQHLAPGGVLVVDFSNGHWIRTNFQPSGVVPSSQGDIILHRELDPTGDRCLGHYEVPGASDQPARRFHHEFRLYGLGEMLRLLAGEGFDVIATHAEFDQGTSPAPGSRYIQIVASRSSPAPRRLATYRPPEALAITPGRLDLTHAGDELEFCSKNPNVVLQQVLSRYPDDKRSYRLDDPWGSARLASAFGTFLHLDLPPEQVVGGSGTTGLFPALADLLRGGVLGTTGGAHPDLSVWVSERGGTTVPLECVAVPHGVTGIQVDRPGRTAHVMAVPEIEAWCRLAAKNGAVVIVDEVSASYLEPDDTAARLIGQTTNLIVLRSISKGFACGGLRVGVAICSAPIAPLLREAVPPLQVSSSDAEVADALLTAPDPLIRLRHRIAEVRPQVEAAFAETGLSVLGDRRLPWLLIPREPRADAVLHRAGLVARHFVADGGQEYWRLFLPLSARRLDDFSGRMKAPIDTYVRAINKDRK